MSIEGWSQDGRPGGCGVRVSSQLGHLPGTGGGPWTPKGVGGTPERLGRTWGGVDGGGEVEVGWEAGPRPDRLPSKTPSGRAEPKPHPHISTQGLTSLQLRGS